KKSYHLRMPNLYNSLFVQLKFFYDEKPEKIYGYCGTSLYKWSYSYWTYSGSVHPRRYLCQILTTSKPRCGVHLRQRRTRSGDFDESQKRRNHSARSNRQIRRDYQKIF